MQSADSTRPCGAQPRVVALTVGVLPEERYRWRYLAAGMDEFPREAHRRQPPGCSPQALYASRLIECVPSPAANEDIPAARDPWKAVSKLSPKLRRICGYGDGQAMEW